MRSTYEIDESFYQHQSRQTSRFTNPAPTSRFTNPSPKHPALQTLAQHPALQTLPQHPALQTLPQTSRFANPGPTSRFTNHAPNIPLYKPYPKHPALQTRPQTNSSFVFSGAIGPGVRAGGSDVSGTCSAARQLRSCDVYQLLSLKKVLAIYVVHYPSPVLGPN